MNYDPEYCRGVCRRRTWLLRHMLGEREIRDPHDTIQALRKTQFIGESNHLSHGDYPILALNLYELGIDFTAITGRENVFIPYLRKVFEKFGPIKIPIKDSETNGLNKTELRAIDDAIRRKMSEGRNIHNFAEGGRMYDSRLGEFEKVISHFAVKAAKDLKLDVLVSPQLFWWEPSQIERPYFPTLERWKHRWHNLPYVGIDLFAFGKAYIEGLFSLPERKVIHVFGRTFPIRECKNGAELRDRVREEIVSLAKEHAPQLLRPSE